MSLVSGSKFSHLYSTEQSYSSELYFIKVHVVFSSEIPSSSSVEEDPSCVDADVSLSIVSDITDKVSPPPCYPTTSQSAPISDSCDNSSAAIFQPTHLLSDTSGAPQNTTPVRSPRKIVTVR